MDDGLRALDDTSLARAVDAFQRKLILDTLAACNVNWAETARLQPWHLYNLNIGKKFGDNTQVTLQINNVLDNKYRLDPTYTGYPYFYSYHGSDILGRRYYLTLQHKF